MAVVTAEQVALCSPVLLCPLGPQSLRTSVPLISLFIQCETVHKCLPSKSIGAHIVALEGFEAWKGKNAQACKAE